MNSPSRYRRDIGWIGLATAVTVTILGSMAGGEIGALAQAYGILGAAAAGFLLAGLWVHDTVRSRRTAPRPTGSHREILHA